MVCGIQGVVNLRRNVAKLLQEGRLDEVAELSDGSGLVMSAVVSRLYEADALARFRAADALGRVSSRVMLRDRGAVEQLLRKLAWSLNEESGATAWGAPHAIGEVARLDAEWASQYNPLLLSYLDDDEVYLGTEIMVHGVVWALGRIGERYSEVGKGSVDALVARLRDEDAITRGGAMVALGRIGDARAKDALLSCVDVEAVVARYVDGQMRREALGGMARGALERLRG